MPEIIAYDRSALPALREWVKVQPVVDPWKIRCAIGRLIGEADFLEYKDNREVVTHLEDGVIVRFNTQSLHGIKPVNKTRYSLFFRQIKAKYLALALSNHYRSEEVSCGIYL